MNAEQIAVTKPKSSFLRKAFKAVAVLLLLTVSLFSVAVIVAFALEKTVKQRIVEEINKQVTVPIKVKGGIEFSIISHFPSASLTFRSVEVEDRLRKNNHLLTAQEFSLLCNIFSLFKNEMEFTRVVVKAGELSMFENEQGKNNYNIFKKADDSDSKQSIRLTKAELKNVRFAYESRNQRTIVDALVKNAELKGNFSDTQFNVDAAGKLSVKQIAVGGEKYLNDKNVTLDVSMQVNTATNKYTFTRGKLEVEKTGFTVTGFFALLKNATQVDFTLSNSGKDVRDLVALLPENIRSSFSETEGRGEYSIEADVKGNISSTSYPKIKVRAALKDNEVKFGSYNKFLKQVNATAVYESDEKGNNKLVISNFNCTLNNLPFHFKLTLANLSNPSFDFYADGALHLSEISSLIPDSVLQEPDGKIHFHQFHLTGKKSDFTDAGESSLSGSGEFRLDGVEFRQNGITYGNINGLLKYENRQIDASDFTLNFLGTDVAFNGNIHNLLAFVYNLSSKRTANDVVMGVNGKVSMNTFNLSGIIDAYDKKSRPATQQKQKVNIRDVFNMQGNLQLAIEKFVYRQMKFNKLNANLQIAPGIIRINSLDAHAMQGEVRAQGVVSFTPDNALNINCDVSAVEMDVPEIFKQCDNFGQTTLTDKHLKGTMSAALTMNATWIAYKELDQNSLSAIVDFSIKKGRLLQFEPLRAASKFIRIEELEDIRFADLNNTIKIGGKRIDIPQFEIKSSALNLIFSGFHHFDNTVDYHIKVNLHKVLAQKFNRNTKDVQYIENDPYEGLNLYLSMTGPLTNLKIKYDKPATRNKIKEDFKKEKEELRNLIKGIAPKVDENEKKREEKYFDTKEPTKFMDFDEE
ncbi:MAG: AsmA family protein [Chitinophagales bacterium]|nr:AsmA family protein [Chitinophagales bacterium]